MAGASAQLAVPLANPLATPLVYNNLPYAVNAPVIAAPIAAASSQYQAQDELGNINYGYANINSAKQEVGNAYGGVTGSYSYVDANGLPQRVDYIADGLGFRVRATNLPIGPAPIAAVTVDSPKPVEDTAEVMMAKAEFAKAYAAAEAAAAGKEEEKMAEAKMAEEEKPEEKSRRRRQAILAAPAALPLAAAPATTITYTAAAPALAATPLAAIAAPAALPLAAPAALPLAAPAALPLAAPAIAAPALAYNAISAPAARSAVLTKIQLNPGHAVAYRVD
jgi:hypothetical protein